MVPKLGEQQKRQTAPHPKSVFILGTFNMQEDWLEE